ncbi:MAG: hypothetical protein EZS28_028711, partial [Streblomastix strix]
FLTGINRAPYNIYDKFLYFQFHEKLLYICEYYTLFDVDDLLVFLNIPPHRCWSWFRQTQSSGIYFDFLKPFVIALSMAYNLVLSSSDNSFLATLAYIKMNQAQALKNLMENGTSIEYFNDRYIMKAKDMIKMYEEGKKSAKTLTQAQQTKLLLQARGGGQTKPKRATKRQIESDFDEDADDKYSQSERKFQPSEQLYSDDEGNDQTIVEKPMKTPKPTPYSHRDQADSSAQKTKKKSQINYTSPQVDLEELIYQVPEPYAEEIPEIWFNETDLW